MTRTTPLLLTAILIAGCSATDAGDAARAFPDRQLYRMQDVQSRWASFENPTGAKGQAATANHGAKGAAFMPLAAGQSMVLLDAKGPGMIRRFWLTIFDKSPKMLRGTRLEMFWDNARTPAVSVPLGDFFGQSGGQMTRFESDLFSSPTGTSFDCFIPMPFRKAARVVITNETDTDQPCLFYDLDYTLGDMLDADTLYFHAHWRRENPTRLGRDFEILPRVSGRGRFLGSSVAVAWLTTTGVGVEGEVKVYLDGDTTYPTMAGTGTEDFIGGGWGPGVFSHRYQGCTIDQRELLAFYRFHIPDPIFFQRDCRVTLQQMTGGDKKTVQAMAQAGTPLQIVASVTHGQPAHPLLDTHPGITPDAAPDNAFLYVETAYDVSATAYFYLNRPENGLPPLEPVNDRSAGLK